ncbi:receptor-type tyrosine-protein phosphatase beta-like isoform X2 [Boleophthalmus pectinirostris]|uniref:receptor-type tyrosine-protein phosphatase beta-like isoform X2 n=1 Tax=Boleophthalmus pectinirostris TaxID=150288 RepID=UPI00242B7F63|nr:receptor-type tyrosine-protein phosphatase beta-like isoform X2 [Boleophthalmus pectinirostris]
MRVQTFSRAQILEEFTLRFQSLAANDNRGFKLEFEDLDEVGQNLPSRAGNTEANQNKNRYPYIVPYDHCRVRLSVQNQNPYSDYINASYVPGGGTERDFICTQGPLPHTVADFWRMVWEQNVQIIVMVTALRHKDIILCEKYWPLEPGTAQHGRIHVTTMNRKQGPDCVITTLKLQQRDFPTDRTVTHYYYSSWPDLGIPKEPASLCAFTEHVRQHLETLPRLGPTVVHCSAGVGRSGTFVALLWLMQLCARGIRPDVRAAVEDLRLHRMWMVQKLQYIFVYQCLLHWLNARIVGSAWLQLQSPSLNPNQSQPQSSAPTGNKVRKKHRQRRKSTSDQEQCTTHFLHPSNLLRKLLPSSTLPKKGSKMSPTSPSR